MQVYYQPVKYYHVSDPSYDTSEQLMSTASTQVTLNRLYPASKYTIYIRSINAVGAGSRSTPVTAVLPPAGQKWEKCISFSHTVYRCTFFFIAPDFVPTMIASTTSGVVLNLQKPSNINGELRYMPLCC